MRSKLETTDHRCGVFHSLDSIDCIGQGRVRHKDGSEYFRQGSKVCGLGGGWDIENKAQDFVRWGRFDFFFTHF